MTTVTRAMKIDASVVGTPVSRFVDVFLPQQYWRAIVFLLTGRIPPVTRFSMVPIWYPFRSRFILFLVFCSSFN